MKKIIIMICFCLTNLGCSTLKESTWLGVGIGSVVGAGFGAAAGSSRGKESKGAVTGAAVGAALGGLMGFLDHKERAKKQKMKLKTGFGPSGDKTPFLTKPQVQRVWVPEKIEGDKYIEGHWLYVIDRPSVWRKD
jgi:hypothetical protein